MKSYFAHIKDNKIYRALDKVVLITCPMLFILFIYIFNRYIASININMQSLIYLILGQALILVILQSRALGRDIKDIESLAIQELKQISSETIEPITSWKKYKMKYLYIEMIPAFLLLSLLFIAIKFPFSYFWETSIFMFIIYVLVDGLLRLKAFSNYMNELVYKYQSLIQTDTTKSNFIRFDIKKIIVFIFALGLIFLILLNYILLPDLSALHLLLYIFAFCVVCLLAISMKYAYREFYRTLKQLDELRKMIGSPDES